MQPLILCNQSYGKKQCVSQRNTYAYYFKISKCIFLFIFFIAFCNYHTKQASHSHTDTHSLSPFHTCTHTHGFWLLLMSCRWRSPLLFQTERHTHHLTLSLESLFFSSLSLSNLVTLELRENLLKSLPSWVFSHQTAVIRSTVFMLWIYTQNIYKNNVKCEICLDHSLALFPSWLNWNSWIWAAMYWKFW